MNTTLFMTTPPSRKEHAETASTQSLDLLQPGQQAVVEYLGGSSIAVRQRLLEMGLTRGTRIDVIRFAPLGDPIEIAVRGYRLSLRKQEASSIIVRRIQDPA